MRLALIATQKLMVAGLSPKTVHIFGIPLSDG
jgi:hypothetical protein